MSVLWRDTEGIEGQEDAGGGGEAAGAERCEFFGEIFEPVAAAESGATEEGTESGEETIFLVREGPLGVALIEEGSGEGDENFVDEFIGVASGCVEEEVADTGCFGGQDLCWCSCLLV